MSDFKDFEDVEFMDDEPALNVKVVRRLEQTYRDLCEDWYEMGFPDEAVLIDPPTFEDRLELLNLTIETHQELLPDGFSEWFNDLIQNTYEVRGEEIASLSLASIISERVFLVPFYSRCSGSC